jgi:hypothetical protein
MQAEFIWAIIKVSIVLVSSLCILLVLAWIAAKKCFPAAEQSRTKDSSVTQLNKSRKSLAA